MSAHANPSRFRICSQYVFLTYPRFPVEPSQAAPLIKTKVPGHVWSVWGREQHQDGTFHLHALIHASPRFDTRNCRALDFVVDGVTYHGDYRSANKPSAVLDYVRKEGQVFYFDSTKEEIENCVEPSVKKRPHIEDVVEMRKQGKSLVQIQREHPEMTSVIVRDGKKINDFITEYLLENARPLRKLQTWTVKNFLGNAVETKILLWLQNNVGKKRSFGQKQLWLGGPTKHGKTTFIMKLLEGLRLYFVPTDEDFYDAYRDGCYDLIVFEEYKAQKTVQFLNKFCDGQPCPLRQKGDQTVKTDNLPIIICSNFKMRETYCNVDQAIFETLERRFEEVWLDKPLDIEPVWEPTAPQPIEETPMEFPCFDEQFQTNNGVIELDKASDRIPNEMDLMCYEELPMCNEEEDILPSLPFI